MANGSWLMAQGSWLMLQGSWLKAHGQDKIARGAGPRGPSAKLFLAMSHEPWAMRLEAWAMSLEPLLVNHINRSPSINEWFIRLFNIGLEYYPRIPIPIPASATPFYNETLYRELTIQLVLAAKSRSNVSGTTCYKKRKTCDYILRHWCFLWC